MLKPVQDPKIQALLSKFVQSVDDLIGIIHLFVPNRHGSIVITRLEEAVLWANVMMSNYPIDENLPPPNEAENAQKKDQEIDLNNAA